MVQVRAHWVLCSALFPLSLHSFCSLSSSSSPQPRCAYVSGCFNFSAHNWDEPQGALIHWDTTVNMSLLSPYPFLSGWGSGLSSVSQSHTRKCTHRLQTQYSTPIKQINYPPRRQEKGLYFDLLFPVINKETQTAQSAAPTQLMTGKKINK